ncbi:MAG: hypothetical protein HN855_08885 [Anaerolineae bacterium]|nr:hypothetical protein [Anaerolineae bacterium]MBT7325260.1 hypothetical protein [Anaerolineae bacterium]
MGSFLLGACGPSDADATPTLSVEEVQTLAVGTFASGLTETAIAMPTNTSTPTLTPSPTATITPMMTNTPGTPFAPGVLPITTSCNSMAYVTDVNIPDNTPMKPGQTFTKTWRVKNNGTCIWEAGFKFNFVGGDAMGSSAFVLDKPVNPGAEIDLSVAMIAPSTAGTIRGNWRMSTASGTYFGDEVYLIIIVGSGISVTSTTIPATATTISDADLTATADAAPAP